MEKREGSSFILPKLGLDNIEEVVWEPYRKDGPGRPPRKPMGIFKALVIKRVRQIPSDRELYRRLWNDPELRDICDIEAEQKHYRTYPDVHHHNAPCSSSRIKAEQTGESQIHSPTRMVNKK